MMNEDAREMPRTDTQPMEVVKFAVPAKLLEEALELAEIEGVKPAELFRAFWESGFSSYAERSNKRLINKRLRREIMDASPPPSPPSE